MDLGLSGKKALVTGASKGIGRAIVEALHGEGAEIIACARDQNNLKKLADSLKGKARLLTHSADLSESGSRSELIDFVKKEFEYIDILVHNVGGPKPTDVRTTAAADWQSGFEQLFA